MSDSEEDASLERQVKISLVGEPSAGKSMLCSRYLGLQWAGSPAPTQGAEILLGECPVRPSHPSVPIKFCDVSGNSCNTSMLQNYIYGSDIVLFVYDVTNLQSFNRLEMWYQAIAHIFKDPETQPLMAIFGNKCDQEHQRAIKLACITSFAEEHKLPSFIGSARTGENINSTVISLVSEVLGVPVNRSLFNNTIIKAELTVNTNRKIEKKKIENQSKTSKEAQMNKKNIENSHTNPEKKEKKKFNKKPFKDFKSKASTSAVCNIQ